MLSVRHRVFEWVAKRNPMADPGGVDALRDELVSMPGRHVITPPALLTDAYDVAPIDGFGPESECPTYSVSPRGAQPERTVFYLHGGGYVVHAAPQHWRYAGLLATAANARVILAQYPIAPERTWRDAHPVALDVYRKIAAETEHELDLVGDSAGGGLALALAQKIVASGDRVPAKLALYTPIGDLSLDVSQPEVDPWMSKHYLVLAGELWAGVDPVQMPELSPLNGSFVGLPPTLVVCGTKDLVLPQARAIVEKARAAGVETTYIEGRGLLHDYPILNNREARFAVRQTADFLTGRPITQGRTSRPMGPGFQAISQRKPSGSPK